MKGVVTAMIVLTMLLSLGACVVAGRGDRDERSGSDSALQNRSTTDKFEQEKATSSNSGL